MTVKIVERVAPRARERAPIRRSLRAYNLARMPHVRKNTGTYAAFIEDEAGEVVGGLWAERVFDWLFVDLLVVPENLRGRGIGADLMARVEAHARALGTIGIWLDTFGFQARGFYEKQGYSCFGTLEGTDPLTDKHLMRKYLR